MRAVCFCYASYHLAFCSYNSQFDWHDLPSGALPQDNYTVCWVVIVARFATTFADTIPANDSVYLATLALLGLSQTNTLVLLSH